ncbi:hypothetical protein [Clostridium tyrobutyricum]|jgi:hypothetical protein|uniref:hypothetical protein n=1 Tax=Clostridium tyrobutyricum TaxID=1519 RepID=UPI0010AB3EE0|nr:hypothetical protein [Clostridium tyrobutyricum]MBV4440130.1 hypothetical protein [Clostridium tyrobutyricum]QCH27339.1 hypothetical protein EZN00_00934 [Clostridium tyrobutyricum]
MDLQLIKAFRIIANKLLNAPSVPQISNNNYYREYKHISNCLDSTLKDVNNNELERMLLSFSARALLLMDRIGIIKITEGELDDSN